MADAIRVGASALWTAPFASLETESVLSPPLMDYHVAGTRRASSPSFPESQRRIMRLVSALQ